MTHHRQRHLLVRYWMPSTAKQATTAAARSATSTTSRFSTGVLAAQHLWPFRGPRKFTCREGGRRNGEDVSPGASLPRRRGLRSRSWPRGDIRAALPSQGWSGSHGTVLIQERNGHPAQQLGVKQPSPAALVFSVSPDPGRRGKKRDRIFPCSSSKEFKKEQDVCTRRHPRSIRLGSEADTTTSLHCSTPTGAQAAGATGAATAPRGLCSQLLFTNEEPATRRGEPLASAHTARWVELGSGSKGMDPRAHPRVRALSPGRCQWGMQRGNSSIRAGPQREEKTFSA